jgi:hypothetical protein
MNKAQGPFQISITGPENSEKITVKDRHNKVFTFRRKTNQILVANHERASVLLLEPNVYIGESLYKFKTEEKIIKFVSKIGNNNVLYDYAVGKKYVYLLLEQVAVNKSFFDMSKDSLDFYTQYYLQDFKDSWWSFLGFHNPDFIKRKEELEEKSFPMIILK